MDFTAFDPLTATEMDNLVENIEALADGSGLDDSAVTTAKINDGAVTNAKLATGAGELGAAWQTWTPTLSNLSGGTQTYAKYIQIGKTVHFRFKYVLGGAGVTGQPTITLPTAVASGYGTDDGDTINATVLYRDTGSAIYPGLASFASATAIKLFVINAAGTYGSFSSISSTVPFTWASTDVIVISGTYEAA